MTAQWEEVNAGVGISYKDSRFAPGYPSMYVNENNELVLKVKVTAASTTEPAVVYMIMDVDGHDVANSESVMHGHSGTDYVYDVWYNNFDTIVDGEVHEYNTGVNVDSENQYVSGFVLDVNSIISDDPTILTVSGEISAELDTSAPRVYSNRVYINEDRDSIVVIANEEFSDTSSVEPSDFVLSGIDGVGIADAELVYGDSYPRQRILLEITGISKGSDISLLKLSYVGTTITDTSIDPLALEKFDDYSVNEGVVLIKEVGHSEDKDSLVVRVEMGIDNQEDAVITYGTAYDVATVVEARHRGSSYNESHRDLRYEIDTVPSGEGNYYVSVEITDLFGDTYSINSSGVTTSVIQKPVITGAEFDVNRKELLISTNTELDWRMSGCDFTISINGVVRTIMGNIYSYDHVDQYYISIDADQCIFDDIEAGDIVKIKYDPKHLSYDYPSGVFNEVDDELEYTGTWIDVTVVN